MQLIDKEKLKCSFCGNNVHQCEKMFVENETVICNECVMLAYNIMKEGNEYE